MNNISRRELLKRSVVIFGATALVGCNPSNTSEPIGTNVSPTQSGEKKDVTVRFFTDESDPSTQEVFKKLADEFMAQYPGVKVEIDYGGLDASYVLLPAGVAAKAAPTLAKTTPADVMQFFRRGVVSNLDDLLETSGGTKNWAFSSLDALMYDGSIFGLPCSGQMYGNLWCRTDLLENAGLNPPTTWDEWKEAAEKTTGNGMYGVSIAGAKGLYTQDTYLTWLWQTGETVFDKDLNVIFGGPGAIAALEHYKYLAQFAPPDFLNYDWGDTVDAYVTGTCAMQQYAARTLKRVYDNNPSILDTTVGVPLPKPKDGSVVTMKIFDAYALFNENVGVPPEEQEIGKKFMLHLLTSTTALDYYASVPGHNDAPYLPLHNDPDLFTKHPLFESHRESIEWSLHTENTLQDVTEAGAIIEKDKVTVGVPNIYYSPILSEVPISQMVQKVIIDGEKPEVAVEWCAEEITRLVAEYKKTL